MFTKILIPALFMATISVNASAFRVIGHRGAAAHAPENTMPGFDHAYEMGLYDIELDVQLTKDGEAILYHDEDLQKKLGLPGKIKDYSWSDLQKAEIGSWFDRERGTSYRKFSGTKLILLEDLFKKHKDHFYYHVEIKSDDLELPSKVIEIIRKNQLTHHSQVTSFKLNQLLKIRSIDSKIQICYLLDESSEGNLLQVIKETREQGFNGVAIRGKVMTKEHVSFAHKQNLFIRAWGIKEKSDMINAIEVGSEGMTIDNPEWIIYRILREKH